MYFDINKPLSYNALWNFLDSNRGLGKTFGTLKFLCNSYKKRNEEFIYTRRTKEELLRVTNTMFYALENEDIIKPFEFRCEGDFIIYNNDIKNDELNKLLINRNETIVNTKKPYRKPSSLKAENDKICGYLIPLSLANQYKSVPFPNVKNILFDEYITENNKYLKNEPEKLISLVETVFRNRDDGRIICLGNSISRFNPYFDFFELLDHENNETTFYKQKSILILHTIGKEFIQNKLKTRFANSIKHTSYGDFILSNVSIKDNHSFINKLKSIPKKPYVNLIINNNNIIVMIAGNKLFFKKGKVNTQMTFNIDNDLYHNSIKSKINNSIHLANIAKFIRNGDIAFDSMEVKRIMEPFILKC